MSLMLHALNVQTKYLRFVWNAMSGKSMCHFQLRCLKMKPKSLNLINLKRIYLN